MVGQICHQEGLKVIGSAGTDEKCEFLKVIFLNHQSIGFDHVINYKKENLDEKLTEYAKDGLDTYFDK